MKTTIAVKSLAALLLGASMQFAVANTFTSGDMVTPADASCSISCKAGQTAQCEANVEGCKCSCN